jgi:uncharacterized repeat protein (TIGR04138 family)
MPPTNQSSSVSHRSLHDVVDAVGVYPIEAFEFVQRGLSYTVHKIHGQQRAADSPKISLHVSGQDLCEGLRQFALAQWGMLARTVLARWSITSTWDFGRIVFAMVEGGLMQKTAQDNIEDFRNVYDFRHAFDANYKIENKQPS